MDRDCTLEKAKIYNEYLMTEIFYSLSVFVLWRDMHHRRPSSQKKSFVITISTVPIIGTARHIFRARSAALNLSTIHDHSLVNHVSL